MKVVRRSQNKFWVFVGGKAFVLKLEKEVQLIPRWRLAGALTFSSFASGLSLALGAVFPGAFLGLMALFLAWAASR